MTRYVLILFITCTLGWVSRLRAQAAGAQDQISTGSSSQSSDIGQEEPRPKDPILATFFSVIPGILVHGSGNFYDKNYSDGTSMLTMEIFGGGLALWGYNVIHYPNNWGPYFGPDAQQAGYWIEAGGWAMMAASFIWDVTTAGQQAISYNKDHDVDFDMESRNGVTELALSHQF